MVDDAVTVLVWRRLHVLEHPYQHHQITTSYCCANIVGISEAGFAVNVKIQIGVSTNASKFDLVTLVTVSVKKCYVGHFYYRSTCTVILINLMQLVQTCKYTRHMHNMPDFPFKKSQIFLNNIDSHFFIRGLTRRIFLFLLNLKPIKLQIEINLDL